MYDLKSGDNVELVTGKILVIRDDLLIRVENHQIGTHIIKNSDTSLPSMFFVNGSIPLYRAIE